MNDCSKDNLYNDKSNESSQSYQCYLDSEQKNYDVRKWAIKGQCKNKNSVNNTVTVAIRSETGRQAYETTQWSQKK